MGNISGYEDGVGKFFGLHEAPNMTLCPSGDVCITVTHLRCSAHDPGTKSVFLPSQPSYFILLYLSDADHCDILQGGIETAVRHYKAGSICVVDLYEGVAIKLHSDLNALAICIPFSFFGATAVLFQMSAGLPLRCMRGAVDQTLWNVGQSLLPLFNKQEQSLPAVLTPISIAICVHLMQLYGQTFAEANISTTRADESLSQPVGLPDHQLNLATPANWPVDRKISFAKYCLCHPAAEIVAVARLCGFKNNADFEAEFCRRTGLMPAAWRQTVFN